MAAGRQCDKEGEDRLVGRLAMLRSDSSPAFPVLCAQDAVLAVVCAESVELYSIADVIARSSQVRSPACPAPAAR